MYLRMAKRLLLETDKRLLWKLAWNMGWKGMLSVERHKRRLKRGEYFPPFLYVSVINSCNLRCQGCWVDVAHKQEIITPGILGRRLAEREWQPDLPGLPSQPGHAVGPSRDRPDEREAAAEVVVERGAVR